MPDKSRTGHRIKALFTVVWDTGLRISALRRLECPRHFAPGDDSLRISRDIDKNRWERPLALTARSRRHLEELVPENGGLIFGEYNYLKTLRATARKVRDQTKMSERECGSLDEGRCSMVDWFDHDGRRYVLARRNPPHSKDPRSLTERESDICACVCLGESNKFISYRLGISRSRVSTVLRSAMRKLGVKTRPQLVERLRGFQRVA